MNRTDLLKLVLSMTAAFFLVVGGPTGCEREPEDKVRDGVEDVGEGVGDAFEDAGDELEDAVD